MIMLIHIIFSKLFLILALSSLIVSAASLINSDPGHTLIRSWCSPAKFGGDISYKSNLDLLLYSLPAKAATTGNSTNSENYNTNSTALGASNSEVIYGLFLCRGDTISKDCSGCVSTATTNLPSNCPNAKSAVTWYDKCMVRYSNESFIGNVDGLSMLWKSNDRNVQAIKSYMNESMKLGCDTLKDIASQLGSPKNYSGLSWNGNWKYYSTKNVSFNNFVRINTMAQCTPDLAPKDCELCLQIIIDKMSSYCNGGQRVRMLNPSCNIRCEIYQTKASLLLVPTPLPVSEGNKNEFVTKVIAIVVPLAVVLLMISLCTYFFRRKAKKYPSLDITNGNSLLFKKKMVILLITYARSSARSLEQMILEE
ncbi:cysteine-rich repeat secretory protein 38-like [Chenopodium quinoa]|uniref:cysteine-rich repeat secretory protein 38-like n=1 Tax=Chenopodium quinoa TaxID=63459 RepID=UPI000B79ACEB|nr:cysteine-rich repeat secretory protein 38-like [Chenopodium quinoa]